MDRRLVWVGIGLIALIAVAALVTAALARPPQYYATVYEPKAAPNFTLPVAAGRTFRIIYPLP